MESKKGRPDTHSVPGYSIKYSRSGWYQSAHWLLLIAAVLRLCHLGRVLGAPQAATFSMGAFLRCHGSLVGFLTEGLQNKGWGTESRGPILEICKRMLIKSTGSRASAHLHVLCITDLREVLLWFLHQEHSALKLALSAARANTKP